MKRHALWLLALPMVAVLITLAACGSDDDASGSSSGSDGGGSDGAKSDGSYEPGDAAVGAVSGVVLLHAAKFPAFRLCFENYPDLPPQPDQALMPEANVVGVEVGSAVRIGAMPIPPGKVYVVGQHYAQATPRDPKEKTCRQLIVSEERDLSYQVATEITKPLGVGQVDVLAITGCGGLAWLNTIGLSSSDCADWQETYGSLHARTIDLHGTERATYDTLPIQLVYMSSALDDQRTAGQQLEVTFGELGVDAGVPGYPLDQPVAIPNLFTASKQDKLSVNQNDLAFFGKNGFRIALRPPPTPTPDAGADSGADASTSTSYTAPTFFVDQSLAAVQELSSPQTVPTTYYLAASNYALLLLGDPAVQRTYPDGGANPTYDPRRAVHLLAVPVKDADDAGSLVAPGDGGTIVIDGGDGG